MSSDSSSSQKLPFTSSIIAHLKGAIHLLLVPSGIPLHFRHFHCLNNRVRHFILAISTIFLSLIIANSQLINLTITCLKEDRCASVKTKVYETMFPIPKEKQFEWEKDLPLSVIAIGTLLGTIPLNWISTKLGIRWMMTAYGLISSLATLFIPLAYSACHLFPLLIGLRIAQGFSIATSYVAMGAISAQWTQLSESGIFIGILSCHFQLGPLLANPMAGLFCEYSQWENVYYLFGSISFVFFLLFPLFFRDSPREHFWVSELERRTIEEGKCQILQDEMPPKDGNNSQQRAAPYSKMLKDIVVWGLLISNLGATFGNQIFVQFGPTFLSSINAVNESTSSPKTSTSSPENFYSEMSLNESSASKNSAFMMGLETGLPHLLAAIVKLLAGPLSDRIGKRISEKARVLLFTSISQYMMAALFLCLAFFKNEKIVFVCYTAVTTFAGFWQIGTVKCANLTARHFASLIFSWNNFVTSIIVFILPILKYELASAKDGSGAEWTPIFIGIATIQVLATTFFNFTAQVEPRPWTMDIDLDADVEGKEKDGERGREEEEEVNEMPKEY